MRRVTTGHDEFPTHGVVGLLPGVAVASRNPGPRPSEDELRGERRRGRPTAVGRPAEVPRGRRARP